MKIGRSKTRSKTVVAMIGRLKASKVRKLLVVKIRRKLRISFVRLSARKFQLRRRIFFHPASCLLYAFVSGPSFHLSATGLLLPLATGKSPRKAIQWRCRILPLRCVRR